MGRFFSLSTSVFPCHYHSTKSPYSPSLYYHLLSEGRADKSLGTLKNALSDVGRHWPEKNSNACTVGFNSQQEDRYEYCISREREWTVRGPFIIFLEENKKTQIRIFDRPVESRIRDPKFPATGLPTASSPSSDILEENKKSWYLIGQSRVEYETLKYT